MTPTEELLVLLGHAAKATGEAELAEFAAHHGEAAQRVAQHAHREALVAWERVVEQAQAAAREHLGGHVRCMLAAERAAA